MEFDQRVDAREQKANGRSIFCRLRSHRERHLYQVNVQVSQYLPQGTDYFHEMPSPVDNDTVSLMSSLVAALGLVRGTEFLK